MAITDYKITDGEITDNMVESAPDVLSNTPTNNKKIFDQLVKVFIAKYNDLIDNINSDFVDSNEFGEGITVSDKVRWRYALTKGTSIGLNFSGNITQITTGFRTIVGDIDGLTETDFMDCYLSINGTDYECGDSYASGNSILTSAVINGVTVEIIYDTTNGNITLEHATNPLDTLYWNVSIYRSVAEKVPRKALPADISNDGYTELKSEGKKWNEVTLDKTHDLPDSKLIEETKSGAITTSTEQTATFTLSSTVAEDTILEIFIEEGRYGETVNLTYDMNEVSVPVGGAYVTLTFDNETGNKVYIRAQSVSARSYDVSAWWKHQVELTDTYIPVMRETTSDTAYLCALTVANIDISVGTVSGSSTKDGTFTISSGYAIGIAGYELTGTSGAIRLNKVQADGNGGSYTIVNGSSTSSTNCTLKLKVLCLG